MGTYPLGMETPTVADPASRNTVAAKLRFLGLQAERGQTRLRTLPPGSRARLRRLAESYRRFRQARAALVQLHRQILAAIDQLEKQLLLPPPVAPRGRRK